MIGSPIEWVGLDLDPLPNESTWSIIGRFINNNGIAFHDLKKTCWIKGNIPSIASFVQDVPEFYRLTGWEDNGTERAIFKSLNSALIWWFDDRLRFCPLCLEGGYHSFWFQFIPLTCCPIHDVPLSSTCMECNGATPYFKRTRCSLQKAGRCQKCQGWLCGVAYTMTQHLELRSLRELYTSRFLPLNTWACAVAGLSKITENLVRSKTLGISDSLASAFFRGFIHAILPLPPFCNISRASPITVLSWRAYDNLPLVKEAPACTFVGRGGANAASPGAVRTKVLPVYFATVRLLHQWIFGEEPGRKYPEVLADLVHNGRIGVSDYDPEQAAYALFRYTFEVRRVVIGRKRPYSPYSPYSLEGQIECALRPKIYFRVKQHRLEIRARLLVHYAECYAAVRSRVGEGGELTALLGTQLYAKYLRPCELRSLEKGSGVTECHNFLVFCTIPGLPLRPFKRTSCLDSPIVELLRKPLDGLGLCAQ